MPIDQAALTAELQSPTYRAADGTPLPTDQVAHLLTQPALVPNPQPQGQVLKPLTVSDFMGAVSDTSKKNLATSGYAQTIADKITAQDRPGMGLWIQLAEVSGWITQAEAGSLMGMLSETIPDPAWQATVPGPSRLQQLFGEDYISLAQINQALGR